MLTSVMSLSGCARNVISISMGETCIPEILSISGEDGDQYNVKQVMIKNGVVRLGAVFETANRIDSL
jgi:hypothetical protein